MTEPQCFTDWKPKDEQFKDLLDVTEWKLDTLDRLAPFVLPPALRDLALDEEMLKVLRFSEAQTGAQWPGIDIDALYKPEASRSVGQGKRTSADPLIADNLTSPEGHLAEAVKLVHPHQANVRLEADLMTAAEGAVRLGLFAAKWGSDRFDHLRRLARATAKADSWLLDLRHTRHVPGMKPVFTAAVSSALRWRDRSLPSCLIAGFEIVGEIPLVSSSDQSWSRHSLL